MKLGAAVGFWDVAIARLNHPSSEIKISYTTQYCRYNIILTPFSADLRKKKKGNGFLVRKTSRVWSIFLPQT